MSSISLPIFDFSKLNLQPGATCWLSTCNDVVQALEEYGCFVVTHDKLVPTELYDTVFASLEKLFDLPLENKRKNISHLPYYGYVGNQPFVPSLYEGMGIADATTFQGTQNFTNTMWPQGNHHFCKIVLEYSKLVAEIEETAGRMVFDGYGVKEYESHKESTTYLFRMMKYRVPEEEEDALGCDVHTDKSFLTVLHQNQVPGLEVKAKDGEWISFDPSPSSFIVIAGDALSAWSNGRIRAAVHRVVMTGNESERYSVGLFAYMKGIIGVPKELIDDDHPLRFKPFDNFGLLRYFSANQEESSVEAYCGV